MAILTKEQIKEAKDLGTRKVEVLEWGGEVFVKRLTGLEADKWNQANYERAESRGKKVDFSGSRARYAILVACNEAGGAGGSMTFIEQAAGRPSVNNDKDFVPISERSEPRPIEHFAHCPRGAVPVSIGAARVNGPHQLWRQELWLALGD